MFKFELKSSARGILKSKWSRRILLHFRIGIVSSELGASVFSSYFQVWWLYLAMINLFFHCRFRLCPLLSMLSLNCLDNWSLPSFHCQTRHLLLHRVTSLTRISFFFILSCPSLTHSTSHYHSHHHHFCICFPICRAIIGRTIINSILRSQTH